MDVTKAILTRRSVRKYSKKQIANQLIEKIIQAGIWAPSGLNNQPWRFKIITDEKLKEQLSKCTHYKEIILQAKVLICVFLSIKNSYHRQKDTMAIGACIENMLLQAHQLGIGTCWLGEILNKKEKVNAILNVDIKNYELMAVIACGYPKEEPKSQRKPLSNFIL